MGLRKILITGACGGMGRACARLLGGGGELVLTDINQVMLDEFARELEQEGYRVVAVLAGNLGDNALLARVAQCLDGNQPFTVIHTAGLSPAQADWKSIMAVNLVATEKLMGTLDPLVSAGSVAVLIASMAGHTAPVIEEADRLLAEPLSSGFLDNIDTLIHSLVDPQTPAGVRGISYSLSKRAILAMCERRAVVWGRRGGRICSISPGLMLTPMGRQELADTPGCEALIELAPAGRAGCAMDIALAAKFLVSDDAAFISGCDLKVDGGTFAAMQQMR